jgi:hypothetical protein
MNDDKYIGLDVHRATISVAVLDSVGKVVMESIVETKAESILQCLRGLRGSLHVTFEEGTCAAWLYALLQPQVTQLVVCDPRKNALLKVGNKSDRIDARKLAELLRSNLLRPVFHEDTGLRTLRELARSYLTMTKDVTRVMRRLKAIYRSWAIPCATKQVYSPRHRAEWLAKIKDGGVHRRAELYYQQLDGLRVWHQQVRKELLAEGKKHYATRLLRQIPSIGPIRAILLLALIQTPHHRQRQSRGEDTNDSDLPKEGLRKDISHRWHESSCPKESKTRETDTANDRASAAHIIAAHLCTVTRPVLKATGLNPKNLFKQGRRETRGVLDR